MMFRAIFKTAPAFVCFFENQALTTGDTKMLNEYILVVLFADGVLVFSVIGRTCIFCAAGSLSSAVFERSSTSVV
jgi:hypothetical protein